jgi:hypothetical protein
MGSYSRAAAGWSEGGYGAMVSVPAAHPGLLAAICPDRSPGALKKSLLELRNGSGCVIFTRDSGSGSVSIDGEGRPVIRYWPDKTTQKHMFDVSCSKRCNVSPKHRCCWNSVVAQS